MTTRDNEKIISICAELSLKNRTYLMELIQAGAPSDVLQGLIHILDLFENIPQRLGHQDNGPHVIGGCRPPYPDEYHHGVEGLAKGMALAAEVLAPQLEQMTTAIAELKQAQAQQD